LNLNISIQRHIGIIQYAFYIENDYQPRSASLRQVKYFLDYFLIENKRHSERQQRAHRRKEQTTWDINLKSLQPITLFRATTKHLIDVKLFGQL
jgi:hypothetical protein